MTGPDPNSLWYEDDKRLEGAPWRDNRGRRDRWPRENGRIVRVVGLDDTEIEVQLVGGRWIADGDIGHTQMINVSRFGNGYRPLPDEFLGDVMFVEGFPIAPR